MKILRISDVGHQSAAEEAARILEGGGIVLYPTDTLYGLGVDIQNTGALERLRALKGRERRKPVSVVVATIEELHAHAHLHEGADALVRKHLPGALTLVVKARSHIPEEVTLNGAVGMRIPNDSFVQALAQAFNKPFTATSANLSGHTPRSTPMDIIVAMGPRTELIDLVVDDGPREGGQASTVVLYTGDVPLVLRDGALSREELGIE
ncbi:MAG: threonylcarbamoyl-AMP synthase [Candidatus Pacebacteria bacterium]|nr:threonylcarbamoyl-AMP synthase [Candidatus Paceibacterota bacterium]